MEPNVRFGIIERQSFFQRLLLWTELLDPTNLVLSIEKIEKSRQILLTSEEAFKLDSEDPRIMEAWKRSLSTVHPDNSRLIPVPLRPAAFLPFTTPMVFLSMLPTKTLKSMILPQASLYTYCTTFSMVNGNASYKRGPVESVLLGAGVTASSTFLGLIPRWIFKTPLQNAILKKALPILLLAHISGMNAAASRSLEPIRGIEVMDREGNIIGYSRKAGTKAVKDTATSRVLLFGTSALLPEIFSVYLKRSQFFLQFPWSLWTLKLSCTVLVMGLMVPVSFSLYPQIGQIPSNQLEEEIQLATEETELFYNRGV